MAPQAKGHAGDPYIRFERVDLPYLPVCVSFPYKEV